MEFPCGSRSPGQTSSTACEEGRVPRSGSKLRQKLEEFLRHEQDSKDQRTSSGSDGGKPMGKVTRPLETADLNPTAERDSP